MTHCTFGSQTLTINLAYAITVWTWEKALQPLWGCMHVHRLDLEYFAWIWSMWIVYVNLTILRRYTGRMHKQSTPDHLFSLVAWNEAPHVLLSFPYRYLDERPPVCKMVSGTLGYVHVGQSVLRQWQHSCSSSFT